MKKSRFSNNTSLYLGNDTEMAIVTTDDGCKYELVYDLSSGAISDELM